MAGLVVVLVVLVLYGLVASRLEHWSVTTPIVLVTTGIVLGEGGLGVLHVTANAESVRTVSEITLALLLFADASTIRLRDAEGDALLPGRLLGIGLPLTIAFGTVLAHAVLPINWAEAGLVASILAPTDVALGMAVVTDPAVPARVRRALNIESGLNDGIATPFVVFFLTVAVAEQVHKHWIAGSARDVVLAIAFGAALGWVAGAAARRARRARWTTPLSDALVVTTVALLAYAGAVALQANGFVSAFVAGALFGAASRGELREPTEFTEDMGLFLSFAVWVIFGAIFAGPVLRGGVHLRPVLYAVLSLTVIRMLPVALALAGTKLRRDTVAFMGWFGPRGLASVVFTLLAFEGLHGTSQAKGIAEVATWTILLSVLAHGLSARPFATRYAARLGRAPEGLPELATTTEADTRRRTLGDRRRRVGRHGPEGTAGPGA
jgi:NhaP-type Na+/H+ or K+/H+ antiporter